MLRRADKGTSNIHSHLKYSNITEVLKTYAKYDNRELTFTTFKDHKNHPK